MKIIRVISGIFAVAAFIVYFYSYKYSWFVDKYYISSTIHYIGIYGSIVLLFFTFQKEEKNSWTKYLVYMPVSIFFSVLLYLYIFNLLFDKLIETNKPITAFIFSTIGSFLVFFSNKIGFSNYIKRKWKLLAYRWFNLV